MSDIRVMRTERTLPYAAPAVYDAFASAGTLAVERAAVAGGTHLSGGAGVRVRRIDASARTSPRFFIGGCPVRVTVCETPHDPPGAERAWAALCEHTRRERSELLVLPEFAFLEPVWVHAQFDAHRWAALVQAGAGWLARLGELPCAYVVGAMPVTTDGKPYNQGFLWSPDGGFVALRAKRYFPNEPGGWEARWFTKGTEAFPAFAAGPLTFGLNICTELWALETYGPYAAAGVHAVVSPRATGAATIERWMALAKTVSVRTGTFGLSSNRRHDDGSCGGAGWIIDPEGSELARTSAERPIATVEIDLAAAVAAKSRYPRRSFADA